MSLCEAITTTAGPIRSARGTGSFQATRSADLSMGRLARTSTTVSPESACVNGITVSPASVATLPTSTAPAGPTSSMLHEGSMAIEMLLTGVPRTATRNLASTVMRLLPTS